eukprot:5682395-Amphidinium_carterae.1
MSLRCCTKDEILSNNTLVGARFRGHHHLTTLRLAALLSSAMTGQRCLTKKLMQQVWETPKKNKTTKRRQLFQNLANPAKNTAEKATIRHYAITYGR